MTTKMKSLAEELSEWIREKVDEASAAGVVLGMSGGLDSSVTAVLCKTACPQSTLGLILPCRSDPKDMEHVKLVADKFDIETRTLDILPVFEAVIESLGAVAYAEKGDIATENLKPRLRMLFLYYFANKLNYLVVGTGNKSELAIGYFTKYGDGGADILPLGNLLKTEVRVLADELRIPEEILDKPPSAGLWTGQTDESEIGMSYDELDMILNVIESRDLSGFDKEKVETVKKKIERSEHKRKTPPVAYLGSV